MVNPLTLAKQWFAHQPTDPQHPVPEVPTTAAAFIHGLSINFGPLAEVIREAQIDASLAGAKDAADQLSNAIGGLATVVSEIDWDKWKPGNPKAAHLLAANGFDVLLQQAGIELKGIEDRVRQEIGQILEQSIYEGWNVEQTAKEIDGLINDPNRAKLIAVTEINRAMSKSSFLLYQQNGIAQWDLITAVDPCPICAKIAAHNPHPMTDTQISPEHPRCRCAVAAHIQP